MPIDALLAMVQQHLPKLYFAAGLLCSFLICMLATVLERHFRRNQCLETQAISSAGQYRRFRQDLTKFDRHLEVASTEILDLTDRDFHSA